MDEQAKKDEIYEFIRATLSRNTRNVMVLCQSILLPDTVTTQSIDIGVNNLTLTSHVRQDELPVFIEGDLVIAQIRPENQEPRHPKDGSDN
jgi:hypothetical protein